MGSGVGCTVANLYMTFFEEMALNSAKRIGIPQPGLWIRYVDDVFIIFRHGEEALKDLKSFLNSLRPSIKFTMEVEVRNSLPFLDLQISNLNGSLVFNVYRKPTHTGRYLDRSSCHPQTVFSGIVSCLKKRAERVCSASTLRAEEERLGRTLSASGYTSKDLRSLRSRRKEFTKTRTKESYGVIPYLPGLSEKVRRAFRKAGSDVRYRPPNSLRGILSRKKPANIQRLGMVYRIPCKDCSWSYVGETGRTLTERKKEHMRCVRNFNQNSEIAKHAWDRGHQIHWEGATVLSREANHQNRLFKEAWFTRAHCSGNRVFHQLDGAWNSLI